SARDRRASADPLPARRSSGNGPDRCPALGQACSWQFATLIAARVDRLRMLWAVCEAFLCGAEHSSLATGEESPAEAVRPLLLPCRPQALAAATAELVVGLRRKLAAKPWPDPMARTESFPMSSAFASTLRAALLLAASLTTVGAQAASATPPPQRPAQACAAVTPATCALAQALGRGINLGNMLDPPQEGDWGVRLEPAYIGLVAGAFSTVRLPVRWSNHAAPTADATLDPVFAARVDKAIDALLAKGVYVIVDVHHYSQLSGDNLHPNEFAVDPAVLETRLVNMWRQIGQRYKDRSPKLLFELLNEPHERLDGQAWNELAARTLAVVRQSNPTRAVLIGPGYWNSVRDLPKLRLPPDRNLIVAIHN